MYLAYSFYFHLLTVIEYDILDMFLTSHRQLMALFLVMSDLHVYTAG